MPPVIQSMGLFMFRSPPPVFISMAAQLAAVLPMAALCRARKSKVMEGPRHGDKTSQIFPPVIFLLCGIIPLL